MTFEPGAGLRLFIACDLPAEAKSQLHGLLERLRKGMQFTGAHPTWVSADNLHITMAFLGNQPEDKLAALEAAMSVAAVGAAWPVHLRLHGLELFPTPRQPRVLSVAIQGEVERLVAVHDALQKALADAGFETDARPLRAHITLARIKSLKGLTGMREIVKSHSSFGASDFEIDCLKLYKSTLTSSGAVYDLLASAPFGYATGPRNSAPD